MLEVDLLLKNYLESRYVLADRAEKAQFSALLKLEDGELLAALQRDWMSAERSK